jgi:hypothetical protein
LQKFDLQLLGPPVAVGGAASGSLVERAFGFGRHVFLLISVEWNLDAFKYQPRQRRWPRLIPLRSSNWNKVWAIVEILVFSD